MFMENASDLVELAEALSAITQTFLSNTNKQ